MIMSDSLSEHLHETPPSLGVENQKLGIWALLGSETIFFSALIVTYVVLRGRSISGPLPKEILNIPS
jgi:heme/copper-type cytochrome/quinol oxidase subunit 3